MTYASIYFSAIFIVAVLHLTEGLQCYNCVYLTFNGAPLGDSKCKEGSPDTLVTCSEHTPLPQSPLPFHKHHKTTVGDAFGGEELGPSSENKFACATIQLDGKQLGAPIFALVRTCTINVNLKPGCKTQEIEKWEKDAPSLTKVIKSEVPMDLDRTLEIRGCHCETDKCNFGIENETKTIETKASAGNNIYLSVGLICSITTLCILFIFD